MLLSSLAVGQVSEIKSSSASNARVRSSGGERMGSGSSGGFFAYFFIDFVGSGIVQWQRATLDKREDIPQVLSIESFGQVAIQPSAYYVFNPRVRGNWGIFYSDFRVNYMVEESIDGFEELTTTDWQVIGLNLVNHRNVTVRLGTGLMKENFGERLTFNESVVGVSVRGNDQQLGGSAEYRWARDYTTGAMPRQEWSLFMERKLFDRGALHGFATGGLIFQRYYSHLNVWGLQGGFAFKVY